MWSQTSYFLATIFWCREVICWFHFHVVPCNKVDFLLSILSMVKIDLQYSDGIWINLNQFPFESTHWIKVFIIPVRFLIMWSWYPNQKNLTLKYIRRKATFRWLVSLSHLIKWHDQLRPGTSNYVPKTFCCKKYCSTIILLTFYGNTGWDVT